MPAQLTSLLPNRTIGKLERLHIKPLGKFTNRFTGAHLSRKSGSSLEFADFRDYVPGDDIRFVDWNSFSRLHRPYIKLFHDEEIIHYLILVDGSDSMLFDDKFRRACELAAAFSVMSLRHTERLSIHLLTSAPEQFGPRAGRAELRRAFAFLERAQAGGKAPLEKGLESALQRHRGRGAAIILSDFLTFGDLKRPLTRLFTAGLEIMGVQILGQSEQHPELNGDQRLVDSELDSTLDVTWGGDLLTLYHEQRAAYEAHLAALCRSRCGRFLSTSTEEDLDNFLCDTLRRHGWIA